MRLLTWNIQWGLGVDGRVDLARIAAEINHLGDPDIICMQEVTDGFDELRGNSGGDQFALLAALFPGHCAVIAPALDYSGENGQRRRFGNLLLSRLPIGPIERVPLPRVTDPHFECMPRGLVSMTVLTQSGPLRIMTTHLEWSSPELRQPQIDALRATHEAICRRIAIPARAGKAGYAPQPESRSAILAGDFNMQPAESNRQRLLAPFDNVAVPKFVDAFETLHPNELHPHSMCLVEQGDGPPRCLDYIFCTDDLVPRVRRVHYDQISRASDHQPLVLDLVD
jgi:endonuclease/exonuclease/phosphatase family metal-dependent hydrolase